MTNEEAIAMSTDPGLTESFLEAMTDEEGKPHVLVIQRREWTEETGYWDLLAHPVRMNDE